MASCATGKQTRKKLVSADIFGSFGPTKKKIRSSAVCLLKYNLSSNQLTCRLQAFIKNLTSERGSDSDTRQGEDEEDKKNRFISNYFMLVASSSSVKFSVPLLKKYSKLSY